LDQSTGAVLADSDLINKLVSQIHSFSDQKEKPATTQGKTTPTPAAGTTVPTSQPTTVPDVPTYELYYKGNAGELDAATVSSLDRRLAMLERTVGPPPQDDHTTPGSSFPDLQTGLRALSKKLELLDQTKLDRITQRTRVIIQELESVETTKARTTQQTADEKARSSQVDSLYNLMTRWDSVATSVPQIVARLQSLKEVHEESATALLRLDAVDKQAESINQLLQEGKNALNKVSQNFAANMKVMESNMVSLEGRFNAISEKIEKLARLKALQL